MKSKKIDAWAKREEQMDKNTRKAYSVPLGQCTEFTKAKLEGLKGWDAMDSRFNLIALLKAVIEFICKFEEQKYDVFAMQTAMHRFYVFRQSQQMINKAFLEHFKTLASVVEEHGRKLGIQPAAFIAGLKEAKVSNEDPWKVKPEKLAAAITLAKDKYLAVVLLTSMGYHWYQQLTQELENDVVKRTGNYPWSLMSVYGLIINYRSAGGS